MYSGWKLEFGEPYLGVSMNLRSLSINGGFSSCEEFAPILFVEGLRVTIGDRLHFTVRKIGVKREEQGKNKKLKEQKKLRRGF